MNLARSPPMTSDDRLTRFLDAQRGAYDAALAEVRAGAKRTHWMWFVFPQIAGLGRSETARYYALADLAEATAYLAHPVLGGRLREIVGALQALTDGDAATVFGEIDAMKLRSSLTVFAHADPQGGGLFRQALDRWFGGLEDPATIARMAA